MEMFNPGDRVSWINSDMEGKVARIIDHNTVSVALDNGLEIEATISELTMASGQNIYDHGKLENNTKFSDKAESQTESAFSGLDEGVFLLESSVERNYYLLNNTKYHAIWVLSRIWSSKMQHLNKGECAPESFEKINTQELKLTRDMSLFIQVVFYAAEPLPLRAPKTFHLNTKSKGEKWENQALIPAAGKRSILYRLEMPDLHELFGSTKPETPVETRQQPSTVVNTEVDLHIESLSKHYENMDNAQIIRCQLAAFNHALEKAIAAECSTITFIHGVGTGVLKSEIIDRLRKHPLVSTYQDASAKKYGKGATRVQLRKTLR